MALPASSSIFRHAILLSTTSAAVLGLGINASDDLTSAELVGRFRTVEAAAIWKVIDKG
jgi:hypothetical protein